MTDPITHLTESERQCAADGSPLGERAHEIEAHLRSCAQCAGDTARIARLMTRIRQTPSRPLSDDLWPGIRARIETAKVAPIAPASRSSGADTRRVHRRRLIGIAAAALLTATAGVIGWRVTRAHTSRVLRADAVVALATADDSARAYEEEAKVLLDRLELQRAMLRPEALTAIDHDLAVVDSAIAEVQVAIARNPNDPALRQLLAMSFRQKVDVLLRVGNAS